MAPRLYVEAPPVTPLPFGLLSAATVIDDPGTHWQMGTEYLPDNCGTVYDTAGACTPVSAFNLTSGTVRDFTVTTDAPTNLGSYTVSWGDGTTVTVTGPNLDGLTHTYATPGTYDFQVTGPAGFLVSYPAMPVTDGVAANYDLTSTQGAKVVTDGLPDLVTGVPFTLYHLFRCRPVGTDLEERARNALRAGESRGIERVWEQRMAADPSGALIDGGTALHPVDALAALEGYAAQNYGGVPVIHLPRAVTTLLTAHGAVDRYATRLETKQGAFVASGGGYTGDPGLAATSSPDAAAGQAWAYVTGQVTVRRAPQIEVMAQQGAGTSNDFLALVERPYVVTTECILGAVLVNATFDGQAPA